MDEFRVNFSKRFADCTFAVGVDALSVFEKVSDEVCRGAVYVITDANVFDLYSSVLKKSFGSKTASGRILVLPAGERVKNYKYQLQIHRWLLDNGADRNSCLVGVGGGVICDITGFAAATFMRGISHVLVPTTLLAQVDAAIGGKNGINIESAKNIIGTIKQPSAVIADTRFLETLKADHVKEGLSELLKMAIIKSSALRKLIVPYESASTVGRKKLIQSMVTEGIRSKLAVVKKDQFETGLRKILNFGHTTAHALETVSGYRRISHGKAVAFGMLVALELSARKSNLDKMSVDWAHERIRSLYRKFRIGKASTDDIWEAVAKDKKRLDDKVQFVLLEAFGMPIIETVNKKEFLGAFRRIAEDWGSRS